MTTELERLGFEHPIVTKKNKKLLHDFGPRAENDYTENKREMLLWFLIKGKDPFSEDGYSPETVRKSHYKIERTYRWMWKESGNYRWRFSPDDANAFLDYLVKFDDIPEPQVSEYEKAIKLIFKYINNTTDATIDWSYDREIKRSYDSERDHFRREELRRLYEASLGYKTIRAEEIDADKLAGILARRFDKPKGTITDEDIERANSWKIPTIIGVTNDLGLRPREIEIAKASWFYPEDEVVRIPAEDSVKSDSSWTCGLSSRIAEAVSKWLAERESYTIYDDTDLMWLNESGNPYDNISLNYLLDELMEEAEIEPSYRHLTWYSIRHGVATMWANEEGVHYAKEQMRHEKAETTMNYLHSNEDQQSKSADGKW